MKYTITSMCVKLTLIETNQYFVVSIPIIYDPITVGSVNIIRLNFDFITLVISTFITVIISLRPLPLLLKES